MDQGHSIALDDPDSQKKLREGTHSCVKDCFSCIDETHHSQTCECTEKADGNRPFAADFVRDDACSSETYYGGHTAEDDHHGGVACSGSHGVEDIVVQVCSEGVI